MRYYRIVNSFIAGSVFISPTASSQGDKASTRVCRITDVYGNTDMESKVMANFNKIKRFSLLEDNWDGYGAVSLNGNVIDRACLFYNQLAYLPQVFPTPRNSVQMEFEVDGVYIEIEVFETQIKLLTLIGEDEEEQYIDTAQSVNTLIKQLNEPGFRRKSRAFVSSHPSSFAG